MRRRVDYDPRGTIAGYKRSLAKTARLTREPAWCLVATLATLDNWKYLGIYGANLDRIPEFLGEKLIHFSFNLA
jgi:hypothetical protein